MESHKALSYLPRRAVVLAVLIAVAAVLQTLRPTAFNFRLSLSGGTVEAEVVACCCFAATTMTESGGGSIRRNAGSWSGGQYFFCSRDGISLIEAGVTKSSITGSKRPKTNGSKGLEGDFCCRVSKMTDDGVGVASAILSFASPLTKTS